MMLMSDVDTLYPILTGYSNQHPMLKKGWEKMYLPDENKKGMVRGYVVYASNAVGYISLEEAKKGTTHNLNVAYTFWHRHDENPEAVRSELERLSKCVSGFHSYSAAMLGYEYKEYNRG